MKHLLTLIPYLKKYKTKLILGFVFISCSIALQSIYPLLIGSAIDSITKGTQPFELLIYSVKIVSVVLFSGIFLFLTRRTIIVTSREIENDLRFDFFSHLQFLSKDFYDKKSVGDIMAHATNDINNVRNFLGPGIMYSSQTFLRTIITLSIVFSISIKISLIALAPLPIISFFVYRVMKSAYRRSVKVQEAFSQMTSRAQEDFLGIRLIKAYVREDYAINKFYNISRDYQNKNLKLALIESYSFPMMFLLSGFSMILVIYFGGIEVIKGNFSIGNIAEFLVYLVQLTWPMIALGWVINLIQRAAPSMERINSIMNITSTIKTIQSPVHIKEPQITGDIVFKDVSFRFPNSERWVLKNINLTIPYASTLGITGRVGEGKTTLVNLIPRIYDPTNGAIFWNGYNIKEIPLNVLRNSIGMVTQLSILFSDTLENNIAYSSDNIDLERVEFCAKIAGLYEDVKTFPDKFKTVIGERGVMISGGQKQRVAIARAIYKNPECLILDDSFSAVDTHTEKEILQALKINLQHSTQIVISHRVLTLQNFDKIILLHNGTIREEGTHQQLLGFGGLYYSIYQKQLIEEELKEAN
ncbi:MAG: ABC transporter ATP-binding protein [Ignavibacteria bacterium]